MDAEAAEGVLEFLKEKPTLLRKRVASGDAILLNILADDGAAVTCQAITIYSARHECQVPYSAEAFQVKKASQALGNVALSKAGTTALAFVMGSKDDRQHQEYPWRGHFVIEEIAGTVCAIAGYHLLNEKECGLWEPQYLRQAAFIPDASRPGRVALPYSLLERHLLEELALLESR